MFHPQGVGRYWIVTGIDPVAKQIKVHQALLAKQKVTTFDFTTMYTKLPLPRLSQNVKQAVEEAFKYFAQKNKLSQELMFQLQWDYTGDGIATFAKAGSYKLQDVYEWIDIVLNNVYLTQVALLSSKSLAFLWVASAYFQVYR